MKTIEEILKTKALQNSYSASLAVTSEAKAPIAVSETESELSIFHDEPAKPEDVAQEFLRLRYAYPALAMTDTNAAGFLKVFAEAVQYNGLTKAQLHEAVLNCIANKHQYGELQIADITGYDRKIKLYTYGWACDKEGFTASKLKDSKGDFWWVRNQDKAKAERIWEQTERRN